MFEKRKPSGLEEGFHTCKVCFPTCFCLRVKTFSRAFSDNFLPFYGNHGSDFMCLTIWVLILARMMPSGNI